GLPSRKLSTAAFHSHSRPEPALDGSSTSDQRSRRSPSPMVATRRLAPHTVARINRRAHKERTPKPLEVLHINSQASDAQKATMPARAYVRNDPPRQTRAVAVQAHRRRRPPRYAASKAPTSI